MTFTRCLEPLTGPARDPRCGRSSIVNQRPRLLLLGSAIALAVASPCAGAAAPQQSPSVERDRPQVEAPLSPGAQRIFEAARDKLLQVRTLLREQDSQASVGSGFIVDADGLVITNYHVVSQFALQPQRYRLAYTRAGGSSGALQLLAFDAAHDLALVRMLPAGESSGAVQGRGEATPARPFGVLHFRSRALPLANGERIYSLGNPLDIGFAVHEGNYSGLMQRSFYPRIFFAGALNPGTSGGPTLDREGQVIGVNSATQPAGQQVSFLVPAEFAEELLQRGRTASPITGDVYPELTRQLLAHQALLVQRFLALPWRGAGHPRYRIPVPQEDFMRCWGSSSRAESKGLQFERSDCEMEGGGILVGAFQQTGRLSVRHEAYDGSRLGALRFAQAYSNSFRNERFGAGDFRNVLLGIGSATTEPQCQESFVDREGLPLRAVVCLSAYRKLKGLFDLSVLVTTVDANTQGVQGRFDARGVDFDNTMRLARYYLDGYGWNGSH